MSKATGAAVLAALAMAGAGCGGIEPGPGTPSNGDPQVASEQAQQETPQPVVHASVSLGTGHQLQFVEFKPGMVGVIETGRAMLDVPQATAELTKSVGWTDLYRHFAGASAAIPEGMLAAQGRVAAHAADPTPPPPPEAAEEAANAGDGPHFYNDAEQVWFASTFCPGSHNCIQGWDWTRMQSVKKVGSSTAYGMVGSEGTQTATFDHYYYDCIWSIFYGNDCYWFPIGNHTIAPGTWTSISESGGSYYIKWELMGAGGSTEVSSSAFY